MKDEDKKRTLAIHVRHDYKKEKEGSKKERRRGKEVIVGENRLNVRYGSEKVHKHDVSTWWLYICVCPTKQTELMNGLLVA